MSTRASPFALHRQATFGAGELSPLLHAREDLPQHGAGLARCYNFFVSRLGAAVSRPGMRHVAALSTTSKARLWPYHADDGGSDFCLVFEDHKLSVFRSGAQLNIGAGVTLATDWSQADLAQLRFAQVGRILTIAHPSQPARELVWSGGTTWALTPVSFVVPPYGGATPKLIEWSVGDSSHFKRDWVWKVTQVMRKPSGELYETLPATVTTAGGSNMPHADIPGADISRTAVYVDRPAQLVFRVFGGPPPIGASGDRHVATNIYRGRGKLFGLVGSVEGGQHHPLGAYFWDHGIDPNYAIPPPEGRNPFEILGQAGDVLDTENPRAVCFYEQRQVFGGTNGRPDRLFISAINDYLDFDDPPLPQAESAIESVLASRRREEIRALLGLERLLVFTNRGVWSVSGTGGSPLSATALREIRVQSEVGAEPLDPLTVSDSVLYVREGGRGVRDLTASAEARGYVGSEISSAAAHLFESKVVAWTHAIEPFGLVWLVRNDGRFVSLTYDRSLQALAFSQHETEGHVEEVCAIRESGIDVPYFVTRREIEGVEWRCLERMAAREVDELADACCLDSSVSYSSAVFRPIGTLGITGTTVASLDHLEGREVMALVDGQVCGPFTVTGGAIDFGVEDASSIHVGLAYDCELELLDVPQDKPRKLRVNQVEWRIEGARGLFTGEAQGLWAGENLEDNLVEQAGRVVVDDFGTPSMVSGRLRINVTGRWTDRGRAVIRQAAPLPLTVLAVTRTGEVSD